jgi:hypothetical protein
MMRLRDPSSAYEHGFEEPQVLHTEGERYKEGRTEVNSVFLLPIQKKISEQTCSNGEPIRHTVRGQEYELLTNSLTMGTTNADSTQEGHALDPHTQTLSLSEASEQKER